jgi:vanadium nitrogenase delta subunit
MNQVDEIVTYIQENCLWQFFSRTWDRESNINGILALAFKILTGETPKCETPDERCYFANANSLAAEMKAKLPWLKELGKDDLAGVIAKVKDQIEDITVKHSLNGELNLPGY